MARIWRKKFNENFNQNTTHMSTCKRFKDSFKKENVFFFFWNVYMCTHACMLTKKIV